MVLTSDIREHPPAQHIALRLVGMVAALIAVAVLLQACGERRLGSTVTTESPSSCPPGATVPPPNPQRAQPSGLSGVTDLPYDYDRGAIRVRIACGREVDALIAKYGLLGPATYWNTPPFSASDEAAGLDRAYRITVQTGTEKAEVQRLAGHPEDYEYVQLIWRVPVQVR